MGRGTLPWAALIFRGFDFLWVLFVCLFVSYETSFISTHDFSHFYPSDSLSQPTGLRVIKQLCGA